MTAKTAQSTGTTLRAFNTEDTESKALAQRTRRRTGENPPRFLEGLSRESFSVPSVLISVPSVLNFRND